MSAVLEIPAGWNIMGKPMSPQRGAAPSSNPQPGAAADTERIVLTGFMGSGKTTAGRLLAARLGWRFFDLDREIERREARSVPEIFAEKGEAYFRRSESRALAALLGERRVVLALGGGAPEDLGNRLLLEQTPRTMLVYLCAPLPTLIDRCRKDAVTAGTVDRPLLEQADSRFRIRHPIYERIADHRIETASLDAEQVVSAILQALRVEM